jgi:hypothetical protein
MNKNQCLLGCLLSCLAIFPSMASDNWTVIFDKDPENQSDRCLLESKTFIIDDGQTQTAVKMLYNGTQLYAATKSTLDLSYPNIGLQIGARQQHTIDRVYKKTTAVFESSIEKIHIDFKKGVKAKLALGFWPTWPQTKTRVIEFSLIGYKKAYNKYKKCEKNGKI